MTDGRDLTDGHDSLGGGSGASGMSRRRHSILILSRPKPGVQVKRIWSAAVDIVSDGRARGYAVCNLLPVAIQPDGSNLSTISKSCRSASGPNQAIGYIANKVGYRSIFDIQSPRMAALRLHAVNQKLKGRNFEADTRTVLPPVLPLGTGSVVGPFEVRKKILN